VSVGSKRGEDENKQESMAFISHVSQNSFLHYIFVQEYLILHTLTIYIWYQVTSLALIIVYPGIFSCYTTTRKWALITVSRFVEYISSDVSCKNIPMVMYMHELVISLDLFKLITSSCS
jgi:hypothetical protein